MPSGLAGIYFKLHSLGLTGHGRFQQTKSDENRHVLKIPRTSKNLKFSRGALRPLDYKPAPPPRVRVAREVDAPSLAGRLIDKLRMRPTTSPGAIAGPLFAPSCLLCMASKLLALLEGLCATTQSKRAILAE
ncbi:hypothetical protein WN72_33400 [Bradyrhizobium arachidis]|uniref:Uncharacterized protein n=1 Tax=Bradyrhizobium arachidis TaxID=858423 RepID=A0AAE7NSR4_9BRAD|nr:hypothetical protein WN72_33400 [Bradyrhizobium arachidis]